MPIDNSVTEEQVTAKRAAKAAYDKAYRLKNAEKIRLAKQIQVKLPARKAAIQRWVEEHREQSREIKRAWKSRNPNADKESHARNIDARRAVQAEYRVKNSERLAAKAKAWVLANPERAKATRSAHYAENRHRYIARARSRFVHIDRATPAWANQEAIKEIYKKAGETGMHVDHEIPLKGKNVCGLHVETNLQLLTPRENLTKGNRYAD